MKTYDFKNMNIGYRKAPVAVPGYQKGVALLMVLTVLFALTILGLASTDSSNLQALMVRNNQFRLEAFNTSLSEIEANLEYYVTDEKGTKPIFAAIDINGESIRTISAKNDGSTSDTTATTGLDVLINTGLFQKTVTLQQDGGCALELNSLGGLKNCSLLRLDSYSFYKDTNIGSDQAQQFSFLSF